MEIELHGGTAMMWGRRSVTTYPTAGRPPKGRRGARPLFGAGLLLTATLAAPFVGGVRPAFAVPSLTTVLNTVPPTAPPAIGTPLQDAATLTGLVNPTLTGTIRFDFYGPNNPTCTAIPIFVSIVPVNAGTGTYLSGQFTPTQAGTYQVVASYSGDLNNLPLNTACNDPNESVVITAGPSIQVNKTATPLTLPAPGGTFTYTVVVTNTGPDLVAVTSLTDDIYGDLNGRGTCAIGAVVAPNGGSYTCSFAGPFTGIGGSILTDTVTAIAMTGTGVQVTDTGDASVSLTNVVPTVQVDKTATPLTLPAPGGTFTFTVVVTNTSAETVTVTSLTDNIYGNVATRPGSTCGALIGTTLAPGASSPPCTFTGDFAGGAGAAQTDVVTVTVLDIEGTTAIANDDATVTLTAGPSIQVNKTATPLTLPAPGGTFTYTVVVTNTGPDLVTVTSLTDNIYGDLNGRGTCAIGAVVAPNGGSYTCSFTGPFTGIGGSILTDTVTAIAMTGTGVQVTDTGDASVSLTNVVPTVQVDKTATPLTLPAPGGTFTFTVVVTNTSAETVTVTSLTDNIYGNVATRPGSTCGALIGTTLAPGASSPPCTFTGDFAGGAGAAQTDVVTVTVTDVGGTTAIANDDATVTLTAGPPPVLTTQASTGVMVGGAVHDTATLAGGTNPTGTITFDLFGPDNATCSGTPSFTSLVSVAGTGGYDSASFVPTAAGTYRWQATYSGDANNSPVGPTACLDPAESVNIIAPPVIFITTTASPDIAVGGSVHDTANVAFGTTPTGTITFDLFGPDNATCTGIPIFTSIVSIAGTGSYDSASFVPTAPGTYRWVTAYSGDANNLPVTRECDTPGESVTVTVPSVVSLTTQASTGVMVGGAVHDTATLAGGANPTGTITFDLFGPDNATCSGTPSFTSLVSVAGTGGYDSASFVPTAAGTYRWQATYSGDANNSPVGPTACLDPAESVVVTTPVPTTGSVAVVKQAPADAQQALFTFSIACPGVPNSPFTRSVTGSGTTPTVDNLPTGTVCTATERHKAAFVDQAPKTMPAVVAGQTQTVTVVNVRVAHRTGVLVICASHARGATGRFVYKVAGRPGTVTVGAGHCSGNIRVPAGTARVTELARPAFALARCATSPASRLISCRRSTLTAKVRIVAGGAANKTKLIFRNRKL